MRHEDLDSIAPLVVDYYEWLSGNGGRDPATLLSEVRSLEARRLLLDSMDDIAVVWGLTAPVRTSIQFQQEVI